MLLWRSLLVVLAGWLGFTDMLIGVRWGCRLSPLRLGRFSAAIASARAGCSGRITKVVLMRLRVSGVATVVTVYSIHLRFRSAPTTFKCRTIATKI